MINYLIGDATQPWGDGHKYICHVCNDQGGWGPRDASFASAISRRWKTPEVAYRALPSYQLGGIVISDVEKDISVVGMIAQHGYKRPGNMTPFSYNAAEQCLKRLISVDGTLDRPGKKSAHMPRIGCGLGGADWHSVEAILLNTLVAAGIEVNVYDLP